MQSCERNQTLGWMNLLEGRADIRQQIKARTAVVLGDAPDQPVDTNLEGLTRIVYESDDHVVAF